MNVEHESFCVPKEPHVGCVELRAANTESLLHFRPAAHRQHCFWARNAIFNALRMFGIGSGDEVLVPAYICAAAVDPIVATGARVVFYGIDASCNPEFASIEAGLSPRTRALLVVHYFGFPQPIAALRALCDRHGLRLIEDCAHVLRGHVDGQRLGSFGDASVFSWRKFLPVDDGGTLVTREPLANPVRMRREPVRFTLKVAKSLLDRAADNTGAAWLRAPQRVLSCVRRALRGPAGAAADGMPRAAALNAPALATLPDPLRLSFDAAMADFPMSRISRWMLAHADVERAVAARRRNYRHLHAQLRGERGVRLPFPDLPGDVCPWVLPVVFEGRRDAHRELRRLGIPAATWGGVRPQQLEHGRFPAADDLYDKLVFLPVHQGLSDEHLRRLVELTRRLLESGS